MLKLREHLLFLISLGLGVGFFYQDFFKLGASLFLLTLASKGVCILAKKKAQKQVAFLKEQDARGC